MIHLFPEVARDVLQLAVCLHLGHLPFLRRFPPDLGGPGEGTSERDRMDSSFRGFSGVWARSRGLSGRFSNIFSLCLEERDL